MVKILSTIILSGFIIGCDQHYRYPCQNPDNWAKPECKKPYCEVNGTCPSHIFEKRNGSNGNIFPSDTATSQPANASATITQQSKGEKK